MSLVISVRVGRELARSFLEPSRWRDVKDLQQSLMRLVAWTGGRAVCGGTLRSGYRAGRRCGNARVRRPRVMARRQKRQRDRKAYPNQRKICPLSANSRDFCCRSRCTLVRVRKEPNQSGSHRLGFRRFRRFSNGGGDQIECRDQRLLSDFLWHRR